MDEAKLRKMADIHKALSHYVRLAVMEALYRKDLSVNEIFSRIRRDYSLPVMDRSNLSKHLSVLKSRGIISCRGQGQKRIYRLEASCLIDAIRCALDAACGSNRKPKRRVS